MMQAVCGWCGMELGWKDGPDGEVTHGMCQRCKAEQMVSFHRPRRLAVLCGGFIGLLLLMGWVGECDYQDKLAASVYRPGPSAQSSAAVGLDWPATLAQVGSQPQHGVHAAEEFGHDASPALALGRRASSCPSGPFYDEVRR